MLFQASGYEGFLAELEPFKPVILIRVESFAFHSVNDLNNYSKKMKFDIYQTEFTNRALEAGYSQHNIEKCLDYAENLFQNNVPVIYNTTHLSALVGYNQQYLKKAVSRTTYFYRDFEIRKRNGKKRSVSEPLPSLKEIQLWILKNILYKVKVSPFAKAYKPKVKLTENLRFHKNQKKVLTLDLKDFFPSIKLLEVERIFWKLGYSKSVSNMLAKLCCKDGSLPQGASTSPYLSNIFFMAGDELISDFCKPRKIRYTRYADDLTFSGDFDQSELYDMVSYVIENAGLKINKEKTKLMSPNMRQTVTGIVVNQKAQVVFNKRNELRQTMYYIKKFGLKEHMKHEKIHQTSYLEHLLGKINFVLQINPGDNEFREYKKFLMGQKVPSQELEIA